MKLFKIVCISLALGVMLTGCRGNNRINVVEGNRIVDDNIEPVKIVDPTATYGPLGTDEELALYEELFDINSKIDIKIDISDDELLNIARDYETYSSFGSKSPVYRMADKVTITVNGKEHVYDEVGIRMKGNTSRTDFYNSKEGIYNFVNFRLSFDETFDDEQYYDEAKVWEEEARLERKARNFATLNELEVKYNIVYDNSYVKEYYAHQMFKEYGVLCSNMNLSTFQINEDTMGVWKIYEPIDKTFLQRNLPEEDLGGDLYKAAWTYNGATYQANVSYGIGDKENAVFYNYDLKTNNKTSKHESLINLLDMFNYTSVTKEDFEKFIDKDYWVNFAATSYFCGNPDDMRNNYNNHYVYFLASSGKAIFIPYDNDRVFGLNGWDPTGSSLTEVSPYSQYAQGAQEMQANPIYTKSVCRGGYYIQEYRTLINEIANSKWLDIENFNSVYDIAYKNYSTEAKPNKDYKIIDENSLIFSNAKVNNNLPASEYFSLMKNNAISKIDDYQ